MLNIYSDFLDSNIQCGDFFLDDLDFINFQEFEIPCTKELVLTLTERDTASNDVSSIRIPCTLEGSF